MMKWKQIQYLTVDHEWKCYGEMFPEDNLIEFHEKLTFFLNRGYQSSQVTAMRVSVWREFRGDFILWEVVEYREKKE